MITFSRAGFLCWLLCMPQALVAGPVADMHLHYKWSQQDITTPVDAIALLDRQDIVMGVVIGTPAELALQLHALAANRIVPIFSPYRDSGDWHRWAVDETTVTRARAALASGLYQGIGELHVIGGFAPPLEKAVVLQQLLQLAADFDVPIMIHTEFSRNAFMLNLCQKFPETRILWAHSGALLAPEAVGQVLARCGNVWGGLGARDPWRFVNNPLTAEDGTLLPGWKALLLKYPQRFMTGSDRIRCGRLNNWTVGMRPIVAGRSWQGSGGFTGDGWGNCRRMSRVGSGV